MASITKERIMTIYQVVDEQNHPVGEYLDYDKAMHNAENLTLWYSEHYYHVERLEFSEMH